MKRRCEYGGCRKLVDVGNRYCNDHRTQKNKEYNKQIRTNSVVTANGHTNKEIAQFYASKEWRKVREQILVRDNYICQPCLSKGVIHEANLVHHKNDELRSPNGWARRLDEDNLEAINRACHNTEKHYYSQQRGRG